MKARERKRTSSFHLIHFTAGSAGGMNQSSAAEVSEEVSARPSWGTENFPITLPVAHCEKRFQERGNCFGCAPAVECPLVRPSHTGVSSRSNCYSVTSVLENTLYTR